MGLREGRWEMPDRSSRLKMVVHVELGVVVGEASTAAVSRQWRRVVSPMTVTQSHVANDDDENAVLCQDGMVHTRFTPATRSYQ